MMIVALNWYSYLLTVSFISECNPKRIPFFYIFGEPCETSKKWYWFRTSSKSRACKIPLSGELPPSMRLIWYQNRKDTHKEQ